MKNVRFVIYLPARLRRLGGNALCHAYVGETGVGTTSEMYLWGRDRYIPLEVLCFYCIVDKVEHKYGKRSRHFHGTPCTKSTEGAKGQRMLSASFLPSVPTEIKGGATFLKVGGTSWERSQQNFLYPPQLLASGGYKWKLQNEKIITINIVKTSCIIHKQLL